MLISIVGALAAATLGPNATPDQKANAASLAEADLKSKLKNNNLNFVEQVDKQITDIDKLYKSQTARNKALDAKAKEASEAAAKAATAGIATQIQAIQLTS
jgi:ribosomal protein L14E/L6E/L27E